MDKRQPTYYSGGPNGAPLPDGLAAPEVFQAVVESSFDGIYLTDGEANTLMVNRSYEVISGLRREDLLGRNMRALVAEGAVSASGTLLALEKRETVTLEQKFSTGKRAVITSTPTFGPDGRIVMVLTNVRDITELHTLKEQLSQEEALTQKQLAEIAVIRRQLLAGGEMVAVDEAMLKTMLLVNRVAPLDTMVLLLGETGVGKEMVAGYIHQNGPRRHKSLVKVNCGAIPPPLVESELFGYEAGAFTGADRAGKPGLFEVADGGTIFLDEVGELPPEVQVKLLRVVQNNEITRVGGTRPRQVDVRILAATNRDLAGMVADGRFRQDLYYRLSVFPVTIPPLRRRPADILPLAQAMLDELNRRYAMNKELGQAAALALQRYRWPGNVRELRNVIERAVILSAGEEIQPGELAILPGAAVDSAAGPVPAEMPALNPAPGEPADLKALLEAVEARYILAAYDKHRSVRKAAQSLGMDPATYLRKKRKYQPE